MNWTELKPPTEGVSYYDHVDCKTPLGKFRIEWKSWKESPDYGIDLEDKYIGTEYNLISAKERAKEYLEKIRTELNNYLA